MKKKENNPQIKLTNKRQKMKIKDLPENFNMADCKLNGQYIISGWPKGFWVKKNKSSSRVFPIFFKSFEEIKDWVIEVPFGRVPDVLLEQAMKLQEKYDCCGNPTAAGGHQPHCPVLKEPEEKLGECLPLTFMKNIIEKKKKEFWKVAE